MSQWRDLYQAALLGNPADLDQGIIAAQRAIDERLGELMRGNIQATKEEEQICEALQTLKLLRYKLAEGQHKKAS